MQAAPVAAADELVRTGQCMISPVSAYGLHLRVWALAAAGAIVGVAATGDGVDPGGHRRRPGKFGVVGGHVAVLVSADGVNQLDAGR